MWIALIICLTILILAAGAAALFVWTKKAGPKPADKALERIERLEDEVNSLKLAVGFKRG